MADEIKLLKAEIKRLRKNCLLSPSLETMLKLRGFRIYKKSLLKTCFCLKKYINSYLEKLKRYSFRLFLRDVINIRIFSHLKSHAIRYKGGNAAVYQFLLKTGAIESAREGYRTKTSDKELRRPLNGLLPD
jgi:hypothetical protein